MNIFDFIKSSKKVFWNDPDNGVSSGEYTVISVPDVIEEDSIILIASDYSEAEVYPVSCNPHNPVTLMFPLRPT